MVLSTARRRFHEVEPVRVGMSVKNDTRLSAILIGWHLKWWKVISTTKKWTFFRSASYYVRYVCLPKMSNNDRERRHNDIMLTFFVSFKDHRSGASRSGLFTSIFWFRFKSDCLPRKILYQLPRAFLENCIFMLRFKSGQKVRWSLVEFVFEIHNNEWKNKNKVQIKQNLQTLRFRWLRSECNV